MSRRFAWIASLLFLIAVSGCRSLPAQTAAAPAGPCAIALAQQAGEARIDQEIAAPVRAALQRLIAAGKTVIVERSSKLDLEGVVRVDSELDDFDDKLGGHDATLKVFSSGRPADPEEIANAVAFLCAASTTFITGQTLFVDGGKSLGGLSLL